MSVHTIEYSDGRSIELEFDPKKHYYMVDGKYVPATTTVLDNIAKPALLPWAASMGARWFLDNTSMVPEQGGNIFNYDKHYTANGLSTVILSSRGCPFTCNFCATAAMWGRRVRYRSGPSMIAEIQHCIDTFGVREFRFSDELFTVNKKRTRELMDYFATVDIHWKCSTRVDCVDRKTLEAMKRGGCREIAFGVESADPEVLKYIDKNTKVEQIEKALQLCDEVGI
ncbi:MAG: radical SAM protein, partial [Dehalococcoidia bacterium]|nr:radical SAM protein [Dehalococcoidia bacterium]